MKAHACCGIVISNDCLVQLKCWEKKLSDYQMEVEGFTGQIGKLLETSGSPKSFAISVLSHFNF